MREGVVPNGVTLAVNPFRNARELVGLNADQEKSRGRVLLLQHVENLRSPIRIGPVVKSQRNLSRTITVAPHPVRLRQVLENFVSDEMVVGIDGQIASSMRGLVFDTQNFALA